MADTVYDVVKAVQTLAAGLTGMKHAPQDPPESTAEFPFAMSYATPLSFTDLRPTVKEGHHTIVTEIHVARANLPTDVQAAMPFADSFPDAVRADVTLGGAVTTVKVIRMTFVRLNYGDTDTIGWRIETDIKLRVTG